MSHGSADGDCGEPPVRRRRLEGAPASPLRIVSNAGCAEAHYEDVVSALRSAGAFWSDKLMRGAVPPLSVPGVLARERVEKGEVLCEVPARLHLTAETCREHFAKLCGACEALPSNSPERRAEAAQTTALALLLRGAELRVSTSGKGAEAAAANIQGTLRCDSPQGAKVDANECQTSGAAVATTDAEGQAGGSEDLAQRMAVEASRAPAVWQRCADALLVEDFDRHPYRRWLADPDCFRHSLAPSGEAGHVQAQAEYAGIVFDCVRKHVGLEVLDSGLSKELFLQAWLCLLTRKFSSPRGSAFVPGVDFFNHVPRDPGCAGDWDEDRDVVVLRALRAHELGEEICITYGQLSNPVLLRTYGFTVPPSLEPVWTCTLEEAQLLALCSEEGSNLSPQLAEVLKGLPNIHLDASLVSETLAMLLEVCTAEAANGGAFLRKICAQRISTFDRSDPWLGRVVAPLRRSGDLQDALPNSVLPLEPGCSAEAENFARVKLSEYICLCAHVEALDIAAGRVTTEEVYLSRTGGLQEDLQVLKQAGLLGSVT